MFTQSRPIGFRTAFFVGYTPTYHYAQAALNDMIF